MRSAHYTFTSPESSDIFVAFSIFVMLFDCQNHNENILHNRFIHRMFPFCQHLVTFGLCVGVFENRSNHMDLSLVWRRRFFFTLTALKTRTINTVFHKRIIQICFILNTTSCFYWTKFWRDSRAYFTFNQDMYNRGHDGKITCAAFVSPWF